MIRRLTCLLVCLCVLVPSTARADDWGWLDWLYRLDAKLWGLNTEIHLLCLDANGAPVSCKEWYDIPKLFGATTTENVEFTTIKHQINARVGIYGKYGELTTVNAAQQPITLSGDDAGLWALKLMTTYTYSPDRHISVGVGGGLMQFHGSALTDTHSSAILTPLTIIYSPGGTGSGASTLYLRGEASYITSTLTPNLFKAGAPGSGAGEWNVSFGVGIDLRRR